MRWTMVNVNQGLQADAHVLQLPDGKTILVDVGRSDDGTLIAYLSKVGITEIDQIVITHPHKDHYGGMQQLLQSSLRIRKLLANMPDKPTCDAERPWGCDYADVKRMISDARARPIPVETIQADSTLYDANGTSVRVLCAHDGILPPGPTTINDRSAILRVTHGKVRALLTGDLGNRLGTYLATHLRDELKAHILKLPHHGTETLAGDDFFDEVAPMVQLVPSPRDLWLSERSQRPREYFAKRGNHVYVNGIDGTVEVTIRPTSFVVTTDRKMSNYTID